jgi:FKBP-type peptidyl-prolyl cis-trans isomerase
MKKALILIAALVTIGSGAMAQKKAAAAKPKLSKEDKEFLSKQADGMYAKVETNRGNIYLMLEYKQVPMTVANFVGLAEGTMKNKAKADGVPYYDGIKFHRVIPDFMIQGGCPNGNGSGDPGYSFDDEFLPNSDLAKTAYARGVLAMANRGPNTNGSQFFIMHKNYGLPYSYTIFGHVVQGIETVDSIALAPRSKSDMPLKDQTINHITILRKGKEAEAFDAPVVFETAKVTVAKNKVEAEAKAKAEADRLVKEKFPTAQTSASGLKYIIEKEGEGEHPTPSNTVTIHYTGTLLDGTKFDSSVDKGQPATFPLPRLIKGWQEGLGLIGKGGKIKLIIPPDLGWGAQGVGAIPPNAWTVFDIELFSFEK